MMKTAKQATDLLHKIETIEEEILDLKISVLKKSSAKTGKILSLKGLLRGVDVSEQDIAEVRKSLYGRVKP